MIERHRAVARAISRRDPVVAAMAMGDHFDASVGDMLKATANER
jgi:DNA-binding GntR family transcriptional regulator